MSKDWVTVPVTVLEERERVRGVLRELVEAYRSLINTLGHEDATAADEEKAEARFACAEAAARAELGEKP